LDLAQVRALRNLDRYFYSSQSTSPLREYLSKLVVGGKLLVKRRMRILDAVRTAGLRALWLPDRNRILIDEGIPDLKKRHAEAHEIAHSIIPHHRMFFLGDDRETLSASCHEVLEAEANYGASQLLFMRDSFDTRASDMPKTITTIKALSRVFGNTLTMTLWRFVDAAGDREPTFALISSHPRRRRSTEDVADPCRYFIESTAFRARFSTVTAPDVFECVRSYASRATGGPLGTGEVTLQDDNGAWHRFYMESFFNGYDALTLGSYAGIATRGVLVVA
jgi:hypothetical protein